MKSRCYLLTRVILFSMLCNNVFYFITWSTNAAFTNIFTNSSPKRIIEAGLNMLKKPERRNDLYLPKSEYDRLYDQYHRPEHNRKAMEKIKERIEDIKETQKDVRKTWPVKQVIFFVFFS